jgi:hypothetical protein
MIGQLLSGAIKVVTCPVDILESGLDVLTGGDGSKRSKNESDCPRLGTLRDGICRGLEDLDKEE